MDTPPLEPSRLKTLRINIPLKNKNETIQGLRDAQQEALTIKDMLLKSDATDITKPLCTLSLYFIELADSATLREKIAALENAQELLHKAQRLSPTDDLARELSDDANTRLGMVYEELGNDHAAFEYYQLAAERDVKAQCKLGCMYEEGRGVAQHRGQALKLILAARAEGLAEAIFKFACMCANDELLEKEYNLDVLAEFDRAKRSGLNFDGKVYLQMLGVHSPKDLKGNRRSEQRLFDYLKKDADAGSVEAKFLIGIILSKDGKKSHLQAEQFLVDTKNNPTAWHEIGLMYLSPVNAAQQSVQQISNYGFCQTCLMLWLHYRDNSNYKDLFGNIENPATKKLASECEDTIQQLPEGRFELGLANAKELDGINGFVSVDSGEAYEHLKFAVDQKHPLAAYYLYYYRHQLYEHIDDSQALTIFKKNAETIPEDAWKMAGQYTFDDDFEKNDSDRWLKMVHYSNIAFKSGNATIRNDMFFDLGGNSIGRQCGALFKECVNQPPSLRRNAILRTLKELYTEVAAVDIRPSSAYFWSTVVENAKQALKQMPLDIGTSVQVRSPKGD